MNSFTTDQDAEVRGVELERRVREAWAAYMASTQPLVGREYDDAEAEAWDRLCDRLGEISH